MNLKDCKYRGIFKNSISQKSNFKIFLILCLFFCQFSNLSGQFFDDFTDSNLNSDPVWEGNLDHFIVTDNGELQQNAPSEGTSTLFTQLTLPDSIVWDIQFTMDFSPSANNRQRIYLCLDNPDPTNANGYYIEVGENGSDDALHFYYLEEGTSTLLASGELGALGSDPADAWLMIQYFPEGEWTFHTAYEDGQPLAEELIVFHTGYDFSGNQVFMIENTYTGSRKDKYFYDYLGIKKFELDKEGPVILSAMLTAPNKILIQTNEILDESSANNFGNFAIDPFIGTIVGAELVNNNTGIEITLSQNLESGTIYTINITGIKDVFQNSSNAANFEIKVTDTPKAGDLIVNEILFNPETGGSDFIELVNISEKFLSLQGLVISNQDRMDESAIEENIILLPGQYLALTEDVAYIKERYSSPDTAIIAENDLPGFNNDAGNLSLISEGEVLDAFDYTEEMHYTGLTDVNGVSLERINPNGEGNDPNNWYSASASVGYATPGYQNSVFLNPDLSGGEILSLESNTFSPDEDGNEDRLIIKYRLPEVGYTGVIRIFDQRGRPVRKLVNNELLAQEGFFLWDGISDGGELLPVGMYIIAFEALNGQGDVLKERKVAVLAEYLK